MARLATHRQARLAGTVRAHPAPTRKESLGPTTTWTRTAAETLHLNRAMEWRTGLSSTRWRSGNLIDDRYDRHGLYGCARAPRASRVSAEHVLSNPDAIATTEAVRNALIQAAEAIEVERKSDGGLRQLAASLLLDRPLAKQHQTILEFFQQSADAMSAGDRTTL